MERNIDQGSRGLQALNDTEHHEASGLGVVVARTSLFRSEADLCPSRTRFAIRKYVSLFDWIAPQDCGPLIDLRIYKMRISRFADFLHTLGSSYVHVLSLPYSRCWISSDTIGMTLESYLALPQFITSTRIGEISQQHRKYSSPTSLLCLSINLRSTDFLEGFQLP